MLPSWGTAVRFRILEVFFGSSKWTEEVGASGPPESREWTGNRMFLTQDVRGRAGDRWYDARKNRGKKGKRGPLGKASRGRTSVWKGGGATSNPIPECYTSRRLTACFPRAGIGDRFHREASMERIEEFFAGPTLYLTMVWGVATAIFLILIAWRSVLSSHEDDQIFIDAAEEHMAREQRELVAKIESLSKPLLASGITSGVLLLLIAGMFVYHGLKNF